MDPLDLRKHFLLRPEVTFLNHGSFGVTPIKVLHAAEAIRIEVERNPVQFFNRTLPERVRGVRAKLGEYLGAEPNNLVPVENATYGVNLVLQALELKSGDEVLTSNQEYGAFRRLFERVEERTGAKVIQKEISFPVESQNTLLQEFLSGITDQTKVIFLSHIASRAALRFPLAEICEAARERGIITVIDGAHVPGHIPLNLSEIGADFYTGNLHKWFLAPRPVGFLYVNPEKRSLLSPLVISWGEESGIPFGSELDSEFVWLGTRDHANFLSIPAAFHFREEVCWEKAMENTRGRAAEAKRHLEALSFVEQLYPSDEDFVAQMFAVGLEVKDPYGLYETLQSKYDIEVSLNPWEGSERATAVLRVCLQCYNTSKDIDRLFEALKVEV